VKQNRIKKIFKRKSVWAGMYAVYLALILMSVQAFLAQDSVETIRDNMDPSYDYYLTFWNDGVTTHYTVTRHDTSIPGKLHLTYHTDANKLDITKLENIKTLEIDVQKLFEDESEKVFKQAPSIISTMDMDYWLEAGDGIFTVTFDIASDEPLEELTFTKFPSPTSVLVDGQEWWDTSTDYSTTGNSITITNIPTGATTVVLDFNVANLVPTAAFTMNPDGFANVNQQVTFDASSSIDTDGLISSWLWDFGDTGTDSGEKDVTHKYTAPGTYNVTLTVRDDDDAIDKAVKSITVDYGATDDSDNDDLFDKWEWDNFGNLDETAAGDKDGDNYVNGLEQKASTDPTDENSYNEDYDSDALPDTWEWQYFESLDKGAAEDSDDDGATNKEEYDAGTDPSDPTSKPKEDEPSDDGEGLLGLGKMAGIDMLIIIILIVVIILVAVVGAVMRSKKAKDRAKAPPAAPPAGAPPALRAPPAMAPPAAPPQMRGPPPQQVMQPPVQAPPPQMGVEQPPAEAPPELPVRGPPTEGPPGMFEPGMAPGLPGMMAPGMPEEEPPSEPGVPEEPAVEEPVSEEDTRESTISSFAAELDIGLFEAGVLYDAGYSSYADLDGALVEELGMIDEIGPDTAERIKNNLEFVDKGTGAEEAPAVPEHEADIDTPSMDLPGAEEPPAPTGLEEPAPEVEEPTAPEPEEPGEPAEEGAGGMLECPVCGEPVAAGTTNCPVCDSPM
jgi:PKD repeat protein